MSVNFLKINESKTQCLIISPSSFSPSIMTNLCILFSGSIITPSLECVNLGVAFDDKMSMHRYINNIIAKGYFQLSNFWNVADKLTIELKISLVTSYILPLIDYCNVTYLAASKQFVYKLQNSAVRFIYNLSGDRCRLPISPYLEKLHLLPVEYRIKYKISLLVYKCFHDKAPAYLKDLLQSSRTFSHLRSDSNL